MWLVGYFLSKYGVRNGNGAPLPPRQLETTEWKRAYTVFYRALGEGRTLFSFANSLKNARDTFDSHVQSGRVGWRESTEQREPADLPVAAAGIFRQWNQRSEEAIWTCVSGYADTNAATITDNVLRDLFAETEPDRSDVSVRTEGGRKAVITSRIERDPSLRDSALHIHGTSCQVCGFSFERSYGTWGRGFAIVHHLRMLADDSAAERLTDPHTDLAVLCANCHCMVHRRRNVVLTLEELSAKLASRH